MKIENNGVIMARLMETMDAHQPDWYITFANESERAETREKCRQAIVTRLVLPMTTIELNPIRNKSRDDGGEFLPTPHGRAVAPWRELIDETRDDRKPARDCLLTR